METTTNPGTVSLTKRNLRRKQPRLKHVDLIKKFNGARQGRGARQQDTPGGVSQQWQRRLGALRFGAFEVVRFVRNHHVAMQRLQRRFEFRQQVVGDNDNAWLVAEFAFARHDDLNAERVEVEPFDEFVLPVVAQGRRAHDQYGPDMTTIQQK